MDVVVVTYHSADHVGRCLERVRHWDRCGRVIVVDNASADNSVDVAALYADEVIRQPVNHGFGSGQNVGVERVSTARFLALNPDALVHGAGLDAGLDELDRHDGVAMTQGVIRRAIDGEPERTHGPEPGLAELASHRLQVDRLLGEAAKRRVAAGLGKRYYGDRTPEVPTATPFLAMVAPMLRTAAFRAVGGFDERYFLYAEDVDLGVRLRQAGWELRALPIDWAEHVGGASSSGRAGERERHWRRGHARLAATHWSGWRRLAARALVGPAGDD